MTGDESVRYAVQPPIATLDGDRCQPEMQIASFS